MIIYPAVDIRDGACVQLVGGDYASEAIRIQNPAAVAVGWADLGFTHLHLVDLDAATGSGSNSRIIADIMEQKRASYSVGGGIRSREAIRRLVDAGADRVVIGTRALEDQSWLATTADEFPGTIVVAADVRDRTVLTSGWKKQSPIGFAETLSSLDGLPLGGIMITAVHREGQQAGTDIQLFMDACALTSKPVIASGGITTLEDLRALKAAGAAAVVIGMALYTGTLNPALVAEEFAQ